MQKPCFAQPLPSMWLRLLFQHVCIPPPRVLWMCAVIVCLALSCCCASQPCAPAADYPVLWFGSRPDSAPCMSVVWPCLGPCCVLVCWPHASPSGGAVLLHFYHFCELLGSRLCWCPGVFQWRCCCLWHCVAWALQIVGRRFFWAPKCLCAQHTAGHLGAGVMVWQQYGSGSFSAAPESGCGGTAAFQGADSWLCGTASGCITQRVQEWCLR